MITIRMMLSFLFFSMSSLYMKEFDTSCNEDIGMQADKATMSKEKQQWITVFVHGTYGSSLGLMSLAQVWRDRPEGTWYHKFQQAMRNNGQFYRNRLMSRVGLVRIAVGGRQEEYDDPITKGLISIYDQVAKQLNPASNDIFYAYGWNGLLSQTERRKEAIKLYNELAREVKRCQEAGLSPKIRLITHSHGGNVALNLAAIHELVNEIENKAASQESLGCMKVLIDSLAPLGGQSQGLYKPNPTTFFIDELIMYATPIQQETEGFCFSPFFKRVYNVYSENDVVQVADFISTKARKSRRRIHVENYESVAHNHIKQIRITVERSLKMLDTNEEIKGGKRNVDFKAPLRGGKLVTKFPKDPAHADFWCITWNKRDTFYDPLPLVVFTPYFLELIAQASSAQESIINITKTKKDAKNWFAQFWLVGSSDRKILTSCNLPMKFIKQWRKQLWLARPTSFTYTFSFGTKEPYEE